MTIPLIINGISYDYPETGDLDWGSEATLWAQAVTTGLLQKGGGLFTLLNEVDFGASNGLKSLYYKSRTASVAAAGIVRLAHADTINWRNNANSADLALGVDSSDKLTLDGVLVGGTVTSITATAPLTGGTITTSGNIGLAASGVTPGTYNSLTVDTYGRVTAATSVPPGAGTVTNVATGQGLTGGPITTTGTISVPNNGITYSLFQKSVAASTLLGNDSTSNTNFKEITVGNGLQFTGGSLAIDPATVVTLTGTQTLTNKTLTTPNIAAINVTGGVLTLPTGVTTTLVGLTNVQTITNKTLTSPTISTILNSGTLTLPTSTDTLVGRATTDTLTNKSINGVNNSITNVQISSAVSGLGTGVATFLSTPSSANLASAMTDETGSGNLVFSVGPTLTSAVVNGVTLTTAGGTTNFLRADGTYAAPAAGSVAWGSITGTLSSQTDLQTALNLKANLAGPTFTGTVTLPAGQVVNGVTLTNAGGTTNFLRADGTYAAPTGTGTVTSVSVTTANGVSGSVATATTTPAITLTLGAITPSSIVASGSISGSNLSGTNTGDQTSVTGNAGTATALQTARTINGTSFDGTANITVTAAAGTLTGTTLNSSVVTSSLTSLGTIGTGVWQGTVVAGQYGGTGVANTGKTITLGGNLTTSGAFATTLTSTAATNVTLPTTGTLATLAGTESLTNKSVNGVTLTTAGGTTNFLRADGTYATPAGGSATPGGSNTQLQYNNSGSFGGMSMVYSPAFGPGGEDAIVSATPGAGTGVGMYIAGAGASTGNDGDGITIQGGLGDILKAGGNIVIEAGDSAGVGTGGEISIRGGNSGGGAAGGNITLAPGGALGTARVKILDPSSTLNAILDTSNIASTDKSFAFPNASGNIVVDSASQNLTNKTINGITLTTAGSSTQFLNGQGNYTTPSGGGSGTVTSVSVVSANGFAGSVATSTTTPAITLTTSITGLLKGNGTAISAATSGTDYVIPSGSVATLTTPRTISGTGEATFTTTAFDGSAAVSGAVTLTNSAVIAKVLTAYAPTIGNGFATVSSSDTLLTAPQKLDGNIQGIIATTMQRSACNAVASYISGNYYTNGQTGAVFVGGALANRIYITTFSVAAPLTIQAIGVKVSTGVASSLAKLAIYSCGTDGHPDTKLTTDTADLDCSSTGVKTASLSFTFYPNKLYGLACETTASANLINCTIAQLAPLGFNASTTAAPYTAYLRTATYATALPSTWTFTSSDLANSISPMVLLQAV